MEAENLSFRIIYFTHTELRSIEYPKVLLPALHCFYVSFLPLRRICPYLPYNAAFNYTRKVYRLILPPGKALSVIVVGPTTLY